MAGIICARCTRSGYRTNEMARLNDDLILRVQVDLCGPCRTDAASENAIATNRRTGGTPA